MVLSWSTRYCPVELKINKNIPNVNWTKEIEVKNDEQISQNKMQKLNKPALRHKNKNILYV